MNNRRFIGLTALLAIPVLMLSVLTPAPILAMSITSASVIAFDPVSCVLTIQYTRTATTNDDGHGNDYYAIVVTDSSGAVVSGANYFSNLTDGTAQKVKQLQLTPPSASSTLLTVSYYDNPGMTLIAQSSYPISPKACVTYYPPNNRSVATILVDTPVYQGADVTSGVVGTLKAGQTWFVTTRDSTGQFWQVFVAGPNLGWVKAADISVPPTDITGASNAALPAPIGGGPLGTAAMSGIPAPVVLTIAVGSSASQPSVQTMPQGTIMAVIYPTHLSLHTVASDASSSSATASAGDRYVVLGRLAGQNWIKLSGPAGTGWTTAGYVILSASLDSVPVIGS